MMRKLFEGRRHHCEEASNGRIAVDMFIANLKAVAAAKPSETEDESVDMSTRLYDAIFMDWVMPKMTGLEATAEIRKLGYKGPIIGVTGNAMDADREEFLSAGASHVFTKPLKFHLLKEFFRL